MRKALKIKAYTILLAWLVIFAHNVIPHNHADENSVCISNYTGFHQSGTGNPSGAAVLTNEPAEGAVCHLSNLLFHSFSPENLFTCSLKKVDFTPSSRAEKIELSSNHSYIEDDCPGNSLFRAPPEA